MALQKKKVTPEKEAVEVPSEELARVHEPPTTATDPKMVKEDALTEEEVRALQSKKVSTDRLNRALTLISDTFNLREGHFTVNSFNDTGSKAKIGLSNDEFTIVITLKDTTSLSD